MGNYLTSADMQFTIDLANMGKSLNNWRMIESAFTKGTEMGQEEVAKRIQEKMIYYLGLYGLGGSSIVNSIMVTRMGKGLRLSVGTDYAIYVEYGTGMMGANSRHPNPKGWIYDVNKHGVKGWFYPTTAEDPNPNKHYYGGQLYGWTRGQASRPFMYKAWRWGTSSANAIIGKNIRREVKKCRGVK